MVVTMCEIKVYHVCNGRQELVMDGVVRLTEHEGLVRMESIFGDAKEVVGRLTEVDITSGSATVVSK
jgi:predicted RNA-binding protein